MKRRSLKLKLAIAFTFIICLSFYVVFHRSEPSYKDRKISAWLDDWAANNQNRSGAWEAVRVLGTNALPYAVENLARNDSSLQKKYRELWPKSPGLLQKIFPKPKPLMDSFSGGNVFAYVGTNSISYAIALLKHSSPTVRRSAAQGLASLRRQSLLANQAIPALIEALDEPDDQLRWNICEAFAEMDPDASNAVPSLINVFNVISAQTNTSPELRARFCDALGKIGPTATNALPVLQTTLQIPHTYLRGQTAVAIWRITGDVETTLPILLQGMSQVNDFTKWEWIVALGEMGPQAKAAIPQLKKELTQDHERWVLEYVTNAFLRIDPQAAAELGIKAPPSRNKK